LSFLNLLKSKEMLKKIVFKMNYIAQNDLRHPSRHKNSMILSLKIDYVGFVGQPVSGHTCKIASERAPIE